MSSFQHGLALALIVATSSAAKQLPESIRYLEFPNALPGKIVKVQKVLDPVTGRITLESDHPQVSNVGDLRSLEASEENARRLEKGSLDERLHRKLPSLGLLNRVRVAIRVKRQAHAPLDKTRHSLEEQIQSSRAYLAAGPIVSPYAVAAHHDLPPTGALGDDIIHVEAQRGQLEALKDNPDVAAIWEEMDEESSYAELTTLASSGYNPGPVSSGAGSGINAATFEWGLTSTFLACIGVNPVYWDTFILAGSYEEKRHAHAVFRTLAAAAPGASLYHRASITYNSSGDAAFFVDKGIQTVSISRSRGAQSPYRATYSEFLTMDNMTYNYPYPVFSNPTHNDGYDYEVNWQGYNGISVGNVRHTNQSTYEMAGCTQTKNPPPRYGSCISGNGPDCTGDREMPHIVAPGIPPSDSYFATTCLEGIGNLACGTSMSAPLVNGAAATIMAADYKMPRWPEKVRAVLILTAQNVEGGDWTATTDERDGTGVLSTSEAVSFVQTHVDVGPNGTAVEKGMAAASFRATDFPSNKRFYFVVPNPKPSGRHLRAVLTWDSNPVVNSGVNALSDLDLVVQHDGGTTVSSHWDSNVEVVDVAAANLTAGNTYYIELAPWVNRIPPEASFFYYALAWTWVKDHAP